MYAEPGAGIPATEVFNIKDVPINDIHKTEYDDYAARLQANYTLDNGTLLYASWNRGIKGGNWSNDPLGVVALVDLANIKHHQEVLYSYEVGFKSENEWGMFGGTMAAQVDGVWNDDQYTEATNSQISNEGSYLG